jgi:hypothetical protein
LFETFGRRLSVSSDAAHDQGQYRAGIQSLSLEFVYCRSGEIHSLKHFTTYQAKAVEDGPRQVSLHYTWIEEESVDLNSGALVLFLAVMVVSIFILFDLCGLCTDSNDDDHWYGTDSFYGRLYK